MSDTRKIEKQLNDKISPLFMALFYELSEWAIQERKRFSAKYTASELIFSAIKLETDDIMEIWIDACREDIHNAIVDSLEQCTEMASDTVNASVDSLDEHHRATLFTATKDQYNNVYDYLYREMQQLMDFIIVYSYTDIMVRDYLSDIKRSLKNKLELVAVNTVLKNYGLILKILSKSVGIDGYTWQTMEDDKVRPTHRELNGKYFTWNNPPDEGHPGTPINCRCIALVGTSNGK